MSSQHPKALSLTPTPAHPPESLDVGWIVKILEYFKQAPNSLGYPLVGISVGLLSALKPISSISVQEPIPMFHTTLVAPKLMATRDYTESSKLQ